MDNIADMLNQILSTDEGKSSLEQITGMLEDGTLDLAGILGSMNGNGNKKEEPKKKTENKKNDNPFGGIDMDMIMKIGALMGEMNKSDKNTALLEALRPHLRDENQEKINTAIKLIKLMSLWPIIQESGVLKGLL